MFSCIWQRVALLALMATLLPGTAAYAQSSARFPADPVKLGQIDNQDLTAAPFVADSAATAVVLCDYGVVSFPTEGQFRLDRITRVKILRRAGFSWANVEVLLRHDQPGYTERLENVRGTTYNLVNGQVERTPLTKANVFLDQKSDQHAIQRVALPQVREGSVVEVAYTLYSNYLSTLRTWEFQYPIPVRWSELRATIPAQLNYKMFVQNRQPLAVDEHGVANPLLPTFRWAMREVPALRPEPFMTTPADYVEKVFFELANFGQRDVSRSWEHIDQYILHEWELGQQLDHPGFLKADLARLPPPTPDNALARLAAVRALVCAAVRCTGDLGVQTTIPLRKLYQETHRGSIAAVNFLLITALRGAGFEANPVLLSTRGHGRVHTGLPQLSQFNYVAAHVRLPDGQELVLDATAPLLPYDMLPERCLNQQGRLVTGQAATARWVSLLPRYRRIHLQRVQLRLAPDGGLSGQMHEEFGGYAGAQLRTELQETGERKLAARIAADQPGWAFSAFAVTGRDSVQRPLALDYAVALLPADPAPAPGPSFHLSPLRDFGLTRNPFRTENRQFPVDFGYAREETLVVSLTLPEGYELAALPAPLALNLPNEGGRFLCSTATSAPGTVVLTSRLSLSRAVYPAAQYPHLRELYRRLLEKQAEQLVVQKKAGS